MIPARGRGVIGAIMAGTIASITGSRSRAPGGEAGRSRRHPRRSQGDRTFDHALHGIKSRTRLYNVLYPVLSPLILAAKWITPGFVTTTERVGQAMLRIAKKGYPKKLLENPDINAAAINQ